MTVCKKTVSATTFLFLFACTFMFLNQAIATPTCLYCRRSDFTAPLLTSYSFCNITDTCVQDRWNYINRPCKSRWIKAS